MKIYMAPVRQQSRRNASPSRRQATAPAQQRRTAAAAPSRRQAAEEPDEATPFDAGQEADDDAADDSADEAFQDEAPQVLDLSDVKATTYEPIPKGWYRGWIDDYEYGLSQGKNLAMLTLMVKVVTLETDDDGNEEEKERSLRYYCMLQGDAAGRSKALVEALLPEAEIDWAHLEPEALGEELTGVEVKVRVTVRPDREDRKIKRNQIATMELDTGEDDAFTG